MIFCDNKIGYRQAQAGPNIDRLCGKKWLERPFSYIFRHAGAVIFHFDPDLLTCLHGAKKYLLGACPIALLSHGLGSVFEKIENNLLYLAFLTVDLRNVRIVFF